MPDQSSHPPQQPAEPPRPAPPSSLSNLTYVTLASISTLPAIIAAFFTAKSTATNQADASVRASQPEVVRSAAEIAKRQILLEIDRLIVSSAGKITKSGKVEYWKGVYIIVGKEEDGRFRVNFGVPFKDFAPIVVATPIDPSSVVNVLDVDTTGFTIQGTMIDGTKKAHVAFAFVAVEPEKKN